MNPKTADKKCAPLLLLGMGRSGTTLFQRILNSYDDVIVWGEHAGFLADLAESYFTVRDSNSMEQFSYPQARGGAVSLRDYKDPKQWQAWNNWFTKEDVDCFYRGLLKRAFSGVWQEDLNYWGFKEIRYGDNDRVVEMFLQLFPETKIVAIYRNPFNVIESQLSSFANIGGRLEKLRKIFNLPEVLRMSLKWRRRNLSYLSWAAGNKSSFVFFNFEKFIADESVQRAVMQKLDLPLTDTQLQVLKLKEGRGSAFNRENAKSSSTNTRWKRLGFIPALVVFLITFRAFRKVKASTHNGLVE